MKTLSKLLISSLATLTLFGCNATPTKNAVPASPEEADTLKKHMSQTFAALEMYSADNGSRYPDTLEALKPRYLEEIPRDPVSREPLTYEKTSDGFLLGCRGDYSAVKAEKGFPKMNQDGFYVFKAADFPQDELPDATESPTP